MMKYSYSYPLCGPYRTRTAIPPCKGDMLANYIIQPVTTVKSFHLNNPAVGTPYLSVGTHYFRLNFTSRTL